MKYFLLTLLSLVLCVKPVLSDMATCIDQVSELMDAETFEEIDEVFEVIVSIKTPQASYNELSRKWFSLVSYSSMEKVGSIFRPPIFS